MHYWTVVVVTERVKVIEGCSRKIKKIMVMEAGEDSVEHWLLRTAVADIDSAVSTDGICGSLLR